MKKIFLIWLLVPFLCFSQSDDLDYFFYQNEDGLVFCTDMFYDYYNAEGKITTNQKQIIKDALLGHENYINSENHFSEDLFKSYKTLLTFSSFENKNTLAFSEKIYSFISDDIGYSTYLFDVVHDLVTRYNQQDNHLKSKQILQKHKSILENHKHFTCGNGSQRYYNMLGIMYFQTYQGLNEVDEQLHYGFKYLLNNKEFSKQLVKILVENHDVEEIKKAFRNLEFNYHKESSIVNSYFQLLDYKILTNGFSGVFYFEVRSKSIIEQLKDIWFYKNLKTYLSK